VNFFIDYNFGVGVSIDGPGNIHNSNRCFRSGEGSYLSVMKGIKALRKRDYNIHVIPVITDASVHKASELFDFFVSNRINHFAFTPCFPKRSMSAQSAGDFSKYMVNVRGFGKFMVDIFDLWMELNNSDISIRYLKEITKMLLGGESSLCIFRKGHFCYRFITFDTNGNVYPCDSYMSKDFLLGNIKDSTLKELLSSPKYNMFKKNVVKTSNDCQACSIYEVCGGGCSFYRYFPKGDFSNKSHYCEAMKMIVNHICKRLFLNKEEDDFYV